MTAKLDICIVSGRRAELLQRTLESFNQRLFRHFDIGNCYANIDPIFGDEQDETETLAVLRSVFPDAHARTPKTPSFGAAVKHIWQSSKSDFVFHLEDDWIVNEAIEPSMIFPVFNNPSVMQVSLNNLHKHWNFKKGPFHHNHRKRKILGFTVNDGPAFPCFTTSPSFLRGDFARSVSVLMDDKFDPEKQLQ